MSKLFYIAIVEMYIMVVMGAKFAKNTFICTCLRNVLIDMVLK